MTRFIIRRILQSFLILLAVSAISFTVQRLTPGGPTQFAEDPRLPKEYSDQLKRDFGLDEPVHIQYVRWLQQLGQLNFGRSFQDNRPVIEKIAERLPNTLLLSGSALLISLVGIPLGIVAALKRNSRFDHGLRAFSVVINCVPHWWLGLLIFVLMVSTGVIIFPIGGVYTPGNGSPLDRLHHLILPALLAGLSGWLGFSRFMRAEMLEVISQDYIRTARAKGLAEKTVIYGHALRNALIVLVTLMGGILAGLISGGVLFEYVFSWPGMGRLAIESANQRDYPVVMALVMITASLLILGNLVADIAYGFVDPRIKYE
ncbi:MAG: ABC transporter permease [Dehalococcoidia bacterium]